MAVEIVAQRHRVPIQHYEISRRQNSSCRHSREHGNPLAFYGRKMDPCFRGDDASFAEGVTHRGDDASFAEGVIHRGDDTSFEELSLISVVISNLRVAKARDAQILKSVIPAKAGIHLHLTDATWDWRVRVDRKSSRRA